MDIRVGEGDVGSTEPHLIHKTRYVVLIFCVNGIHLKEVTYADSAKNSLKKHSV
jgi:hypothetical protein